MNKPDSVPVLNDIWTSALEESAKRAKQSALQYYIEKMEGVLPNKEGVMPIEEEELLSAHAEGLRKALEIFNNQSIGLSEEKSQHLESLQKEISVEENRQREKYEVSRDGILVLDKPPQKVEYKACVGGKYFEYFTRNYKLSEAHCINLIREIRGRVKRFSNMDEYYKFLLQKSFLHKLFTG